MRFDAARIRQYYDRNTSAFVTFGRGGDVGAIHRAVWGPGVTERRQAFRFVENRIADVIRGLPASDPHVVDLGCGVGASLCYLAEQVAIRGTGVTLSPAQAAMARQRIAALGLADRVRCLEGDYADLPAGIEPADVAFAIESFAHAPDPARFFAECARVLRPGGTLIVCDDVRGTDADAAAAATIDRFCRGWHVNTLLTSVGMRALAEQAGFEHESTRDLTPYLELRRPRDVVIAALVAPFAVLPGRWTRLDPWIGGTALQTCLAHRWVRYELAIFRRAQGSGDAKASPLRT